MANDELSAGFTGTPTEPPTGVRKIAKAATGAVGREANAVVVGASDHPYTATGLALTVGAVAFAIGYIVGRSSVKAAEATGDRSRALQNRAAGRRAAGVGAGGRRRGVRPRSTVTRSRQ